MNLPKLTIFIFYKTKDNTYRGFCSPYDVTYESESKEETEAELKKLVALYEEGLKKYNFPKHLSVKQLSNLEDKRVFNIALEQILDDFKHKMLKKYHEYQASKKREEIKLNHISGTASYSPPQNAYPN